MFSPEPPVSQVDDSSTYDAPPRRARGLFPGLAAGSLAGALAIYVSYAHLKQPQNSLDWAALILSGLTVGIIAFFIVWGHFQGDPEITEGVPVQPSVCPLCGGPVKIRDNADGAMGVLTVLALHVPIGNVVECEKCDWKSNNRDLNKRIRRHESLNRKS